MTDSDKKELSDQEIARRMEAGLRRAMITPPSPHKPDKQKKPKGRKPAKR